MEKEWDDVESFVNELRTVLDEEAKTIRETDFDQAGGYREATLSFHAENGVYHQEKVQAFVDRLGRVILPAKSYYRTLDEVTFLDEENGGEPAVRSVVSVETRFKGQKVSAYVVYLEDTK